MRSPVQNLQALSAELRRWPLVRWAVALAVATLSAGLLVLASALPGAGPGGGANSATVAETAWALAAVAAGSGLVGLIAASYLRTPIGAEATACDLRWPALGLLALHFSTDFRSVEPLLFGAARPIVAGAAIALLLWAVRERLASESRATGPEAGAGASGPVCTSCRPLFPRAPAPRARDHTAGAAPGGSVGGTP